MIDKDDMRIFKAGFAALIPVILNGSDADRIQAIALAIDGIEILDAMIDTE